MPPPVPPSSSRMSTYLTTLHRLLTRLLTTLLAHLLALLSLIIISARWIWILLTQWWRITVVLVFLLLVMLGANALSLSLLGICVRCVYDWVVGVQMERDRERFWAVRGRRRRVR